MSPAADPRTAIGYVRVSTDDQHLSPEAQRAAIETWAKREGVRVVAWHEDRGISGAAPIDKRPGLLGALEALREHRAGVSSLRSATVSRVTSWPRRRSSAWPRRPARRW